MIVELVFLSSSFSLRTSGQDRLLGFMSFLPCFLALTLLSGEGAKQAGEEPAAEASFLQHTLHLEDSHIAAATEASASPGVQTFSLFVKFHKVAGSTWRQYLDEITGEDSLCSGDCGFPGWPCYQSSRNTLEYELCPRPKSSWCSKRPTSCTFHGSLGVIYQAIDGQNLTVANSSDLAGVRNLWPDSKRFWLLHRVEWARIWLPQNMFNLQRSRILITTVLRDPVERIRSYYYYQPLGFARGLGFRAEGDRPAT
eukprot:s6589_g2.t1